MPLPVLPENARSKDLAEALAQAGSEYVDLYNKRSSGNASEKDIADLKEHMNFINDLDPIARAMARSEEILERQKMLTEAEDIVGRGPVAALDDASRARGYRSMGQRAVESEQYKTFTNRAADATFRDIPVVGSLHNQRTLLTTGTSDSGGSYEAGGWLPVGQPIPPIPRQQKLFVRDLMSRITTTLNAVPYILEQGPTSTEYGATAVAQGTAKPEVEMDFLLQTAVVTKIAAWVPATTEIIEDAPALRGYIDTRLAYMLALREEQQLLFGTGIGAQLHGLFAWNSGPIQNQTQSTTSGDLATGTGLCIGKIANVDLTADGAVYNPLDYWAAVTTRYSTHFDNGYGGAAPAVLSQISWGLPSTTSRSFAVGSYGVAAFQMSATIADREQTIIRVGNQHGTYFTENKVAILAEERLAELVHRPDGAVLGTK